MNHKFKNSGKKKRGNQTNHESIKNNFLINKFVFGRPPKQKQKQQKTKKQEETYSRKPKAPYCKNCRNHRNLRDHYKLLQLKKLEFSFKFTRAEQKLPNI